MRTQGRSSTLAAHSSATAGISRRSSSSSKRRTSARSTSTRRWRCSDTRRRIRRQARGHSTWICRSSDGAVPCAPRCSSGGWHSIPRRCAFASATSSHAFAFAISTAGGATNTRWTPVRASWSNACVRWAWTFATKSLTTTIETSATATSNRCRPLPACWRWNEPHDHCGARVVYSRSARRGERADRRAYLYGSGHVVHGAGGFYARSRTEQPAGYVRAAHGHGDVRAPSQATRRDGDLADHGKYDRRSCVLRVGRRIQGPQHRHRGLGLRQEAAGDACKRHAGVFSKYYAQRRL